MLKRLILFFVFTLNILLVFSQKQADNWLSGFTWLDFSTGQPIIHSFPSALSTNWGSACMSDANGKLLFYSDGFFVFNAEGQRMAGATSGLQGVHNEATQPVIAIPFPGRDSLFYLFYLDIPSFFEYEAKLRYAIIDMRLQNGLGEVTTKDIEPFPGFFFSYKLSATIHCNRRDYWLIGHLNQSDQYVSILISESGISTTPVYSTANWIQGMDQNDRVYGCMKVDPLGGKVAAAFRSRNNDFVELSDFNNSNGQITNSKKLVVKPPYALNDLNHTPGGVHGIEFSPSGSYLYVSSNYEVAYPCCNYSTGHLHQFELGLGSEAAIQNSLILLDSIAAGLMYAIQIANNGVLYINNSNAMSLIKNPENKAPGCNYQRYALENTGYSKDLPVFLQSYFRFPIVATGNCQFTNIQFSILGATGVNGVLWDFGDTASGTANQSSSMTPTHYYSKEGAFRVKLLLNNSNGCGVDTVFKTVHAGPFSVFLGSDSTICYRDSLVKRVDVPNSSILWSDNSTGSSIIIKDAGKYWVQASVGECIASDSLNLSIQPLPTFSLGNDKAICDNHMVTIQPSSTYSKSTYLWNDGSSQSFLDVNTAGNYWLKIIDSIGCRYSDSINIVSNQSTKFSLGEDTMVCTGASLILNSSIFDASYLWNNGSTDPSILVNQTGLYWLDITKDQCKTRDSINVFFKPSPIVKLGADTSLCEGQQLILDAKNSGASYVWQDLSRSEIFTVEGQGEFYVHVLENGCEASDTISITMNKKPVFSLGPDQVLCGSNAIVLSPNYNEGDFTWQDGSKTNSYSTSTPGLYFLEISNACGVTRDSINVVNGDCDIFIPNAFSPNGDGVNDRFSVLRTQNIVEFKMEIFNRWGQIIFQTEDKTQGWDGKLNGIVQPSNTFVYLIHYKTRNSGISRIAHGTVQLLK